MILRSWRKCALALAVIAAGIGSYSDCAYADSIDFNFTGATLNGVNPLVSDNDNDWGSGDPLPTGAKDTGNAGDYIEDGTDSIDGVEFIESGLKVTITASSKVYGDLKGAKGGLGVFDGANAGSNDNIQANESLKFTFDKQVYIGGGYFFGADHGTVNFDGSESFKVIVDGTEYYRSFSTTDGLVNLGLTGTVFEFVRITGDANYTGEDFYVTMFSAAVTPEPGTIVLMGVAGLGLIVLGRRRKRLATEGTSV